MESIRTCCVAAAILLVLIGVSVHGAAQNRPTKGEKGKAWTHEPSPLVWISTYTTTPPKIDGKLDDAWKTAKPVTVIVREAMGGDHPKPVVLRALHTHDTLYVAAQWRDKTRSDMRDPYVWNPQAEKYERPSRPDDQFAIEFPITGDFAISMLTVMREYTADVWHWKAGRGNPLGWVDDKYHVISQSPVPNAKKYVLHGKRSVYILRKKDAGTSAYKLKPAPTIKRGNVVDSFIQQKPTGSLADVRGKGRHDGKGWTLEICRKFNTSHSDDAVIDPTRDNLCAIAVLNDELYEEHSVSTVITLRFVGGPASEKQVLWNFDEREELPSGWKVDTTSPKGKLATWKVVPDEYASSRPNVLSITKINDTSRRAFNLCWTPKVAFRNGVIEVKVRANTGTIDQGGGPIWRVKDGQNYYIARYNPLERNFRLYYVKDSSRRQLDDAKVNIKTGQWFTIKIVHRGEKIEGWINGKKLLQVADTTFMEPGGVGVWTKADAGTSFDDISMRSKVGVYE